MKIHHIGVFTNHPRRLLTFYEKQLGFKKEYKTLLPKSLVTQIFGVEHDCFLVKLLLDTTCIELFWLKGKKLKETNQLLIGINHFCITVSDKRVFCETLAKKHKIKIIKVHRDKNYYVYFIKDPDNNLIEVKDGK